MGLNPGLAFKAEKEALGTYKNTGVNTAAMENIDDTCDTIMEFSSGKELYVSIDASIVDFAFAPATVHSEIGGLTSRQIIYLISRINKIRNLKP